MKKCILCTLLLGLFTSPNSIAQFENMVLGARANAMGNVATVHTDEWTLWNNIGALAQNENLSVLGTYHLPFGMADFQTFALGAVAPLKFGGVAGLSITRFGDELYNEMQIGLGYSHQIDKVSLGLKVNYAQVAFQDLGSIGTVVLEFGGLAEITPKFHFGAHIYNLNQAKFSSDFSEDEEIPTIMRAGLSYQPIKPLNLVFETEKNINFPASFKFGVDYNVFKNIYFRTGIETEAFISHFGIGFYHKKLRIDYALASESTLGLSHQFSMLWQIK